MTVSFGVVDSPGMGLANTSGVGVARTGYIDVGGYVNAGSPYSSTPTVIVLTIEAYNWHSGLDNSFTISAPGWTVLLDPNTNQTHTRIGFNGGKTAVGLLWRYYPSGLPIAGSELLTVSVGAAWTFGDYLTGWPEMRFIFDRSLNAVAKPKFDTPYMWLQHQHGGATMPAGTYTPGMVPDPGAEGVVVARSIAMSPVSGSGIPGLVNGNNWDGRSIVQWVNRTTTPLPVMPSFNSSLARIGGYWGYSVRGVPERHGGAYQFRRGHRAHIAGATGVSIQGR